MEQKKYYEHDLKRMTVYQLQEIARHEKIIPATTQAEKISEASLIFLSPNQMAASVAPPRPKINPGKCKT